MADVRATITVHIGGVPFYDGVIDPHCLTVTKAAPIVGIPGLIDDVPQTRATIAHVEECGCGDRSRALTMTIPSRDFTIDTSGRVSP